MDLRRSVQRQKMTLWVPASEFQRHHRDPAAGHVCSDRRPFRMYLPSELGQPRSDSINVTSIGRRQRLSARRDSGRCRGDA